MLQDLHPLLQNGIHIGLLGICAGSVDPLPSLSRSQKLCPCPLDGMNQWKWMISQ